ncbi:MAG: metal ABC transporter substrate-binding protein, partial [bacterium]
MKNNKLTAKLSIAWTLFMWIPMTSAADIPKVYTVSYPLAYFAERIAGDHANIVFPVPADLDPAFWNPNAAIINQFQQADLILLNGASYAKWVDNVSLPRSKLIDTSANFKEFYLTADKNATHSHGLEGDHSHGDVHFTTWLDLSMAAKQAEAINAAFAASFPEHKTDFQDNYSVLEEELLSLDQQLKSVVSAAPPHPLLASHPVYQYLAKRYDLNIQSVLWEPDKFPDEKQWAELGQFVANHPASIIIWEGAPLQMTIDRLQSMGIN